MENTIKKNYFKIYKELPESVRNLFWSESITSAISKIEENYSIDKNNNLVSKIIGLVLFGELPPSKIPEVLETEIEVNYEEANKITNEIKRSLISAKSFLEKTYEERFFVTETKEVEKKSTDSYREST